MEFPLLLKSIFVLNHNPVLLPSEAHWCVARRPSRRILSRCEAAPNTTGSRGSYQTQKHYFSHITKEQEQKQRRRFVQQFSRHCGEAVIAALGLEDCSGEGRMYCSPTGDLERALDPSGPWRPLLYFGLLGKLGRFSEVIHEGSCNTTWCTRVLHPAAVFPERSADGRQASTCRFSWRSKHQPFSVKAVQSSPDLGLTSFF